MRGHVGRSRLLNGRATRNVSGFPNSVDSNCATKNHPVRLGSRNPSFRSKPVSSTLLPISGRRPREIDGRARNRRAPRFRVNALASRPQTEITRSRLRRAYGVLRPKLESTGCARGGLPCFNLGGPNARRGGVPGQSSPRSRWIVSMLSDRAHRDTSRPERSLVHGSRGRNARTHKQQRGFGRNPDGAEAAERGRLG